MTVSNGKEAYLKEAKELEEGAGYEVVAEGTEKATFKIERNKEGEIKRTCAPVESRDGLLAAAMVVSARALPARPCLKSQRGGLRAAPLAFPSTRTCGRLDRPQSCHQSCS